MTLFSEEAALFALVLNQGGIAWDVQIVSEYRKRFDAQIEDGPVRSQIYKLRKDDVFAELDADGDIFEYVTVEHDEYGLLKSDELMLELGFNFIGLGPKSAQFFNRNRSLIQEAAKFANLEDALALSQGFPIDSSAWTGRPASLGLNPVRKTDLRLLLAEADRRLADDSKANTPEVMQARAYVQSAIFLTDAPDPPEDLIFENIERASAIVGLAQFFAALLSFITGTARA
ncbi:MAG: hypothetical protein IIZ38_13880 [Sphingomonas sp.]|uniref:hypothetical protein n=1 Tax=Sphingomonas sp. TaxID=28214 RepID=UPI0025CCFD58|nr:hypothetical protein [Sphingomonas sp.]MBQ1499397.1 hypothetical protein [Sphingomonas sp.]MBQ8102575.1 hypothetical protein [Afipia sp.]